MPRFSIVIPTRQRADTLRFALETALAQTHSDFEVVVQNNGNDQATNDVVGSFDSPRVVLNGSPNILPQSANFEAGLTASSGEFVAFIGDDDGMMPDACAICDEVMSSQPTLGALHWSPHYYDWPSSLRIVARNRLVINLPGSTAGIICRCRDLLYQLYDGTLGWTNMPLIYNGAFVHRSVLEKVKAFCGGVYFVGDMPDVHSGIANLWAMEQFLHIDRPLSICGASGHSNGNAHFVGSDGVPLQKRYHAENPAFRHKLMEHFLDSANLELGVASALMTAKEIFFYDDPNVTLNMRNTLLRMGMGANRDPNLYEQTVNEMQQVADKYGIDTKSFNIPPKRQVPETPVQGPLNDTGGRTTHLVVNGEQAGLVTIADAVRLASSMLPSRTSAQLNALVAGLAIGPPAKASLVDPGAPESPSEGRTVHAAVPELVSQTVDGLRIPHVFFGLGKYPDVVEVLQTLVSRAGDPGNPRGEWFLADNLITFGHTRGFLTEPRFVAAVTAARATSTELSFVWRTHLLCWAAESCQPLAGDYVECGTYQGYSMEVVMHYLAGLPGRNCHLYDVFDPIGGAGEGKRLPAHSAVLFETVRERFRRWPNVSVVRGKVPEVLAQGAPDRIAFLHLDMNNADAERGALEVLFERVSPGGAIVFDDYGWTGYRAQKQAADVFMRARGLFVLELPTGQGLVVKR